MGLKESKIRRALIVFEDKRYEDEDIAAAAAAAHILDVNTGHKIMRLNDQITKKKDERTFSNKNPHTRTHILLYAYSMKCYK